jgi:hypothetical protein
MSLKQSFRDFLKGFLKQSLKQTLKQSLKQLLKQTLKQSLKQPLNLKQFLKQPLKRFKFKKQFLKNFLCLGGCVWTESYGVHINGYVTNTFEVGRTRATGLISTDRIPQMLDTTEVNLVVKQEFESQTTLYGDISLWGKVAGRFEGQNTQGHRVSLTPSRPSDAKAAGLSLHEMYFSHHVIPRLSVLLGRKRLVWGSGFAQNPTDILNPPKDPVDPSAQRKGAFLALVELPFEQTTLSFVFSPQVQENEQGFPDKVYLLGEEKTRAIWIVRNYWLIADSDINLLLYYNQNYQSRFDRVWHYGGSFSRFFFKEYEGHIEALVQKGSSRSYFHRQGVSFKDSEYMPKILVGGRYQFLDDSLLSLEYLYQAEGYTSQQYEDFISFLGFYQNQKTQTQQNPTQKSQTNQTSQTSQSFLNPAESLKDQWMQHYLILNYQRFKATEDVFLGASVIENLIDASGFLFVNALWVPTQWLNITLTGGTTFIPLSTTGVLYKGKRYPEYGLVPIQYRMGLEVKAYF